MLMLVFISSTISTEDILVVKHMAALLHPSPSLHLRLLFLDCHSMIRINELQFLSFSFDGFRQATNSTGTCGSELLDLEGLIDSIQDPTPAFGEML